MKTNFFRVAKIALVAASALAFMNCGEDATNAVANAVGGDIPTVDQPADSSNLNEPAIDPITGEIVNPEESVTPDEPITDPSVDPTIPSEQPIESSSSTYYGQAQYCNENPRASICSMGVMPMPEETAPGSSEESVVESSSSEAETPVESSSSEEPVQQAPKGIFLADDTDENKDYMEVVYQTGTGDNGGAVLAYPKRLSETQKHGVVLWGPGGGSKPEEYEGLIKRLASHGFVVIGTSESPNGTERGKPALDWLEKKNSTPGDPLYQKLDMTKVGASGHSMGGLQSEQMLINDSRVVTAILNNSGAWDGKAAAQVPTGVGKTIAIVYGEVGSESDNAKNDYNNPGVKIPACLIRMENNNYGHGSGPWDGQAATVAWMRWHLGGEDFRKADFVGSTGKYIDGPVYTWQGAKGNWKGQCKNF